MQHHDFFASAHSSVLLRPSLQSKLHPIASWLQHHSFLVSDQPLFQLSLPAVQSNSRSGASFSMPRTCTNAFGCPPPSAVQLSGDSSQSATDPAAAASLRASSGKSIMATPAEYICRCGEDCTAVARLCNLALMYVSR